jgi:hypothetical protein
VNRDARIKCSSVAGGLVVESYQFQRWEVTDGNSMSAILPVHLSRCGIYVLEFANGEEYVGQTVRLLSRIASHRRRWPDLVAVRFTRVPRDRLTEIESALIVDRRDAGVVLRNIDRMTLPTAAAALDVYVTRQEQQSFLNGEIGPLDIGDRGQHALERIAQRRSPTKLSARPDHDKIVAALAGYVRMCIPQPHLTEGRFWVVTSLPSTGRRPDWRRVSVLTIQTVETVVFGETRRSIEESWHPSGFLNVASHKERRVTSDLWLGGYRSVGEVEQIEFGTPRQLSRQLAHRDVASSARELAVGLLRKGTSPGVRFHDRDLADDVFAALQTGTPSPRFWPWRRPRRVSVHSRV